MQINEAIRFEKGTFQLYSEPYFSFFHNGIKMSGSIAASGLFFVCKLYTIVEKTIIKSLEKGLGKNLSSERFSPVSLHKYCHISITVKDAL